MSRAVPAQCRFGLLLQGGKRQSFYYAGLINTAGALWLITSHYEWWDRPAWGVAVVTPSLAVLAAGWGLSLRERGRGPQGIES